MAAYRFTAELHHVGLNYGVLVPRHVVDELGGDLYILVRGTANGIEFHKRLVPAGDGQRMLYFDRAIRDAGDLEVGSVVDVELVLDLREEEHRLPPDIDAAIASIPAGWGVWEDFGAARRDEILAWISGARRKATRTRRIEQLRREIRARL